VTVRKDEAALIREAARRALSGEGLFGIASDWNRRGIATVTGARWSTRSLSAF
jgi:site-specific DNA recombinase